MPTPAANDTQQAYLDSLKTSYSKEKDKNHLDHQDTTPVALQLRSVTYLAPLALEGEEQTQEILEMKKKVAESKRSLILIK